MNSKYVSVVILAFCLSSPASAVVAVRGKIVPPPPESVTETEAVQALLNREVLLVLAGIKPVGEWTGHIGWDPVGDQLVGLIEREKLYNRDIETSISYHETSGSVGYYHDDSGVIKEIVRTQGSFMRTITFVDRAAFTSRLESPAVRELLRTSPFHNLPPSVIIDRWLTENLGSHLLSGIAYGFPLDDVVAFSQVQASEIMKKVEAEFIESRRNLKVGDILPPPLERPPGPRRYGRSIFTTDGQQLWGYAGFSATTWPEFAAIFRAARKAERFRDQQLKTYSVFELYNDYRRIEAEADCARNLATPENL